MIDPHAAQRAPRTETPDPPDSMRSNYRHVPAIAIAAAIQVKVARGFPVTVELVSDDGMHWEADEGDFTAEGLENALATVDDMGGPWLTVEIEDGPEASYLVDGGQAYLLPGGSHI